MPSLSAQEVQDAMHSYQVNEPQAKAILGALSVKGFALIQGPPGTGKTKTISGMVGKFLAERKAIISVNGQGPSLSKILVCAPSNAAIDEVCKRLMDGVLTPSGKRILPKIVRIGVESSVNVAVKNVSLDNIVEARVNAQAGGKDSGSELARVQAELEEVKNLIKEKQDELANVRGNDELRRKLEGEFHTLNARRTKLGHQTSKAKDAARDATRHLDGARRAAREAVLSEADVVCATLSGSGQDILNQYTFETVIIDEAAQAIEMSCLIPLKYGCQRCIMVGGEFT
jgi:senataxin